MDKSPVPRLTKDTLLILPCSGAKRPGTAPANGQSITSILDAACATELKAARHEQRAKAAVDEGELMPAYLRYAGMLYEYGSKSIGIAVNDGFQVLIVSGGYGLVRACEPIGMYDKKFVLADWPADLLEKCLLNYARHFDIRFVIGLTSRSSGYARLFRKVRWNVIDLHAKLITPVCPPYTGAQGKIPRALGQAVSALITTGLNHDWRSSESLPLAFENL